MKWFFPILSIWLISCALYGADNMSDQMEHAKRPKLTKKESIELAGKMTNVMRTESDHVRTALGDAVRQSTNYHTINIDNPYKEDALKEELTKWALEELAERHNKIKEEKSNEKRKRILASIAAIVGGIATIVTPILTYFLTCDDSCSCG